MNRFLAQKLARSLASLTVILFATASQAASFSWSMSIDRIDTGSAELRNVSLRNSASVNEAAEVSAEVRVEVAFIEIPQADTAVGPFKLLCPGSTIQVVDHLCKGGKWSLLIEDEWPVLEGEVQSLTIEGDSIELETRGQLGQLEWITALTSGTDQSVVAIEIPAQAVKDLAFFRGRIEPLSWVSAGTVSGQITSTQQTGAASDTRANLSLSGIDFDSPDGLYAGAGVSTTFSFTPGREQTLQMAGELLSGELLLMDFYRDFSDRSLRLEAHAGWTESQLEISRFSVTDDEALRVIGQATLPFAQSPAPELVLREFQLEFPLAFDRYLESTASVFGLDGLGTDGSISWTGDWSPGSARNGELRFNRFSVVDEAQGRFTVEGLDGQLLTGTDSRLTWDSMSFEKMNFGSGEAGLELLPEKISLTEPLVIDVLGGHLDLETLSFSMPHEGEPDVQLQASINGIEMLQMSRAMGWPEFDGTLSGRIPGVRWKGGIIDIEGALEFEVFEGTLILTDLHIERPFGVLPSMSANITANNLDLEALTSTFEFGRIGGRADGYVRDLRMLNWQPVQFDAWFGTPPDDEDRHGISRKAVQHLTAIGGGSATAILSGPILKLFNNFSYRRLGLGCRLQNNVCQIRGIEEQGEAVLLLEGAGLPKISIQAFNRSVDWPQLLAELIAVSGGEDIRIGN